MTSDAARATTADQAPPGSAIRDDAGDLAAERPKRRSSRDWLVDSTCFILASGLMLLLEVADDDFHTFLTPHVLTDITVGSLCCTMLWWRRRWPVAIGLIIAALSAYWSGPAGAASLVILFTVAVHRRIQIALGVAAITLALSFATELVKIRHFDPVWLFEPVITLIVISWAMFIRARRQLVASFKDRARLAAQEQQQRIAQARHLERTRVAREMHDVLAHRLSLLSVHAGALEFRTDATAEQTAVAAGVIRANAHQALEELREVIWVLRNDEAAGKPATTSQGTIDTTVPQRPQPGLETIPTLIEESRQAGATIRYECAITAPEDATSAPVTPNIARTIYRVVQEGLTNARKHAPDAPIDIAIRPTEHQTLTVDVTNRLPARPPTNQVPGSGLGLIGLTERVQLAGGRLTNAVTATHFTLRAELPCPR